MLQLNDSEQLRSLEESINQAQIDQKQLNSAILNIEHLEKKILENE